jgi:hypothetical protein
VVASSTGQQLLAIDTSGRVTINSTKSTYPLTINSSITADEGLIVYGPSQLASAIFAPNSLNLIPSTADHTDLVKIVNTASNNLSILDIDSFNLGTGNPARITFGGNVVIQPSGATDMVNMFTVNEDQGAMIFNVDNSNRTVGINASSSTINLNVQGSGTLDPFNVSSSSGTSIFNIKSNLRVGIASSTPNAMFVVQGTNTAGNTTTPIFVVASSTGEQFLTVTTAGKVGLGTTSPYARFAVIGHNFNPSISNGEIGLYIEGGAGSTGAGADAIVVIGGDGNNGTYAGGGGSFTGGAGGIKVSGAGGTGGSFSFTGGTGGGSVTSGTAGVGGAINLTAGTGGAGFSGASNGNGGNVVINGGTAGGSGASDGNVLFATVVGKVGIGTTTPAYKLSVVGTAGANDIFNIASSTGTSYLTVASNGSTTLSSLASAGCVAATASGSLYITTCGGGALTGSGTSGFSAIWNGVSSLTTGKFIDNGTVTGINATSTSYTFNLQGSGGVNPLNISSSTGTSMFVVSQTGNVGIGTSNPLSLLHVAGGAFFSTTSNNTYLTIRTDVAGNGVAGMALVGGNVGNASFALRIQGNNSNELSFVSTDGNERARLSQTGNFSAGGIPNIGGSAISANGGLAVGASYYTLAAPTNGAIIEGNVGLGTTTPSSRLQVVGDIQLGSKGSTTSSSLVFNTGSTTNQTTVRLLATTSLASSYTLTLPTTTPSAGQVLGSTVNGELFWTTAGSGSGNSAFTIGNGLIYNATSTDLVGIGTITPTTTLFVQGKGGTNPFAIASSTGTQLLTLTQSGNLGIGTTTPGNTLSVIGAIDTSSSYKINNAIRLLASANYTELQDGSSNTRIHLGNANDPANYYSNGSHIFRNSGGSLEYARITSGGLFGIGTSSPIATLSVMGTTSQPTLAVFNVASSSGTSYLTVASNGSTTLSSLASAGCVAATASGSLYITTCGGGALTGSGTSGFSAIWNGVSSLTTGKFIDNGTVTGINATSTSYTFNLQGSAGVNPLNIASSTGTSLVVVDQLGRVGIGTNTPISMLNIVGSTTGNGANAIAGILASTTLSNGTTGAFQFGHRFISTIAGAASGTLDGMLIRTIDNTSNANTVRALEVQAYSGSNTSGINTGIQVYGKTFGVYAYTDGLAGSVSQPAALFAELGHPSSGNALRLYSATATGATLMSIYHETSNATGTALSMDLGNGSGSFTGNFIALRKAGTNKVLIDSFGQASFGTTSIGSMFDIASSTSASDINLFRVVSNVGATGNVKFRIDSDGDVYSDGTNNLGSGADLAENYTSLDLTLEPGELVALSDTALASVSSESQDNQIIENVSGIVRASSTTQNILGVVATKPGVLMSSNLLNSKPVALAGRVPVKISLENGPIKIGDYLTASKTVPGAATKALSSGNVVGRALEAYSENSTGGKLLAFVEFGWRNINNIFVLDDNGGQLLGQVGTTTQNSNSIIIDQKGVGNILQLQQAGQNRVVFGNQGDMAILASTTIATTTLLSVTNGTTTMFSINARGDIQTKGIIIVKDDSFAGSIATNGLGEAQINFTYDLGTGKPDVQLTVEGEIPAIAQVVSWIKDSQDRYIGFKLKSFNLSGNPASVIVHYLVIGKQDGYTTSGAPVLTVQSSPNTGSGGAGGGPPSSAGESAPTPTPTPDAGQVAGASTPDVISTPDPIDDPAPTPNTLNSVSDQPLSQDTVVLEPQTPQN